MVLDTIKGYHLGTYVCNGLGYVIANTSEAQWEHRDIPLGMADNEKAMWTVFAAVDKPCPAAYGTPSPLGMARLPISYPIVGNTKKIPKK